MNLLIQHIIVQDQDGQNNNIVTFIIMFMFLYVVQNKSLHYKAFVTSLKIIEEVKLEIGEKRTRKTAVK